MNEKIFLKNFLKKLIQDTNYSALFLRAGLIFIFRKTFWGLLKIFIGKHEHIKGTV
jgi:hypothetical protein